MEIKRFDCFNGEVHFHFVCGNCKKEVAPVDKACRNCGKQLEHLPHIVSVADVASILTAVFKGHPRSEEFNSVRASCPRC